ncbi:hypothetical protein [Halomicrococcus sp. NG-SE-24]
MTDETTPVDESRVAQWLRLLKLLLTVVTLAFTVWQAATGAVPLPA